MKITGWKLKEAIKEHELRRDAARESFDATLTKFEDEVKESPTDVMNQIETEEKAIARLQTAQTAFNLAVQVDVDGEKMSLLEAVKRIGGMTRIEQSWRMAMMHVAPGRSSARHRMMYGGAVSTTEETPKATMTTTQARDATSAACKKANKLKAAIAQANGFELDISDLDPALVS